MTVAPLEAEILSYGKGPQLELVHNASEGEISHNVFDHYFELRDEARGVEKVGGAELHTIQEDVRDYVTSTGLVDMPDAPEGRFHYYTDFSQETARSKILGLVDYLEQHHADKICSVELEATRAFVESTFAMYEDRPEEGDVMCDADGSFAFVVPARMGRTHTDYGQEVEPAIPAFRYIPNELRAAMMVGLPPFVIDTYQHNEEGKRGYLIFAPVFEDMREDLGSSLSLLIKAAHNNINAAVDFAYRRFGTEIIGLGATLPALTNYGKTIINPHVTTTTGHGGTVELIRKTVENSLHNETPDSIGVLGLGAIGEAIARIIANEYPESRVNIYDTKENRIQRIKQEGDQFVGCDNEKTVIENSDILISAITDRLDLKALGVKSLDGLVIVDDSQPGSVDPRQTQELGGATVWVIGKDTKGNVATRRGYDYATMVDPHSDLFGCEAEAASIAKYAAELRERQMPEAVISRIIDKVALKGRVTVRNVHYIGALFSKYGILPSEPQAFGRPVELPTNA